MRQLPHGALSAAGLSSIHQQLDPPAATENPSPLFVLYRASDTGLRQEAQATADYQLGSLPGSIGDLWPTLVLGPPTDQFSPNDPSNYGISQGLEKNSLYPKLAEKLVCLTEQSAANDRLPALAATAYPATNQPREHCGSAREADFGVAEARKVVCGNRRIVRQAPAAGLGHLPQRSGACAENLPGLVSLSRLS